MCPGFSRNSSALHTHTQYPFKKAILQSALRTLSLTAPQKAAEQDAGIAAAPCSGSTSRNSIMHRENNKSSWNYSDSQSLKKPPKQTVKSAFFPPTMLLNTVLGELTGNNDNTPGPKMILHFPHLMTAECEEIPAEVF